MVVVNDNIMLTIFIARVLIIIKSITLLDSFPSRLIWNNEKIKRHNNIDINTLFYKKKGVIICSTSTSVNCDSYDNDNISITNDNIDIEIKNDSDRMLFEKVTNDIHSSQHNNDSSNTSSITRSDINVNLNYFGVDDDKRRGLGASKSMVAGEEILKIPISSCILPIDTDDDDDGDGYTYANEEDEEVLLAVSFIHSLKNKKNYNNWRLMLPSTKEFQSCLPIYWSDDKINMLLSYTGYDHGLLNQTVSLLRIRRVKNIKSIIDITNCSTEEASYALDIIQTRSCRVSEDIDDYDDDDDDSIQILTPIFDLLNHDNDPNKVNAYYNLGSTYTDGYTFIVRALRTIRKDEEIIINYGSSTNQPWQCLLHYGFVPSTTAILNHYTATIAHEKKFFYVTPNSIPYSLLYTLQTQEKISSSSTKNKQEYKLIFTSEFALQIATMCYNRTKLLHNDLCNMKTNNNNNSATSLSLIKDMCQIQHTILDALCLNIQKHINTSWKYWNFDIVRYNNENQPIYVIPTIE